MRRERFDFVYGLGSGCSCWRILRERGLQFASFALDWVGCPGWVDGEGFLKVTDLVVGGFAHWFEEGNLVRCRRFDSPRHDAYCDQATGLVFAHDFLRGDDLHAHYPEVAAKYARRIARFNARMAASRKVLLVWIADPRDVGRIPESDVRSAREAFCRRYPGVAFHFLVTSCVPGIRPESAEVVQGDGYELWAFDYRVVTTGEATWDVRTEMFAPLLDRFVCVDYRTRAERRANAGRERAREYEKFKAKTWWELVVRRLQYKIYRHFRRRLDRNGVLKGLEGGADEATGI